ncbi:MAG: M50 family metallopeptidase [Pirellulaceae bacterium]
MDDLQLNELVRGRRELELIPVQGAATDRECVFDPVSRQSYRVGWIEAWFLRELLRPRASSSTVESLIHGFREQHVSCSIGEAQLLQIFQRLQRSGLVQRAKHVSPTATKDWRSFVSQLVVYQMRGPQPDRFLRAIAPWFDVLFSRRAVWLWLCAACVTLCAVVLNFDQLSGELADFAWWSRPMAGSTLFIIFLITRAVHELGHGIVCTRFGIRVPDIGVFTILGAPCVYCDVSESWKLPWRWQRAAVAAAGMYVELIVATMAAWLWLYTLPGTLHSLAMQTMLVCSAGTLLININPLMRFDGYYILADWLDETNLRSTADRLTMYMLAGQWLGTSEAAPTATLSRGRCVFLVTFSLMGVAYRLLLSLSIATAIVAMSRGWHIPWVGRALAVAILFAWWGTPLMKLLRTLACTLGLRRSMSPSKAHGTLGVRLRVSAIILAALLVVLFTPIPSRRFASGWIEPQQAQGVFAKHTARLVESRAIDGSQVNANQPLFQFASTELGIEQVQLSHELTSIETQSLHAKYAQQSGADPQETNELPSSQHAQELLQDVRKRQSELSCRAPISGHLVVFPANSPCGPLAIDTHHKFRETWTAPQQVGRTVSAGTLLAAVCSDRSHAVIELDKSQLDDVTGGTPVRLRLPHANYAVIESQVKTIVEIDRLGSLWADRREPTRHPSGQFAAIVEIPASVRNLPGASVDAVFIARPTRLASLLYRWGSTNLRLLGD